MISRSTIGRIALAGGLVAMTALAAFSWQQVAHNRDEVAQIERSLERLASSTDERIARAERQARMQGRGSDGEVGWYSDRAVARPGEEPEASSEEEASEQSANGAEGELTDEERNYRNGVFGEARVQKLETSYSRESADPQWSSQAEGTLASAYAGKEFDSLDIVSECKETLCRVEVNFDDLENGPQQLQLLAHRSPWQGQGFQKIDIESRTATLYLAREGHQLVDVDPDELVY